jgi:hypothetical protein
MRLFYLSTAPLEGNGRHTPTCQDDVGLQADQLPRECSYPNGVITAPMKVDPQVAAIGPLQLRKRLRERGEATLPLGIVFVIPHEHADAPHAVALLRACRERPSRRAAEERDEITPSNHSITSVASASTPGGTSMRSARAVCKLMTK